MAERPSTKSAEAGPKRRAYWIADVVSDAMRSRAQLLAGKGFEVQFFTSLDALLKELDAKRAGVIVVSDDGDESKTERILTTLTTMPEIQGARLVMVRTRHSEWLSFLAASGNVRDIIPAQLEDKAWLARFLFATAARAVPFVQPAAQITMNNISSLGVPARVTTIGATRLRLESRLRPPVGASLTLSGPLADALGVAVVNLKVLSVERKRLLYRFSDAITCEWKAGDAPVGRVASVLEELRSQSSGPRCRVFIAAQTLSLRAALLGRFDDPRFEVSTALQKQSIVDEPLYFTPDLILIEDKLVQGDGLARFEQMLANITPEATVVVMGHVDGLEGVVRRNPRRRIAQLAQVPANLAPSALARYARVDTNMSTTDGGATDGGVDAHVLPENPYSIAELGVPARLTRVHPLAAQIATPFPISNFALCRLDSPLVRKLLGRSPRFKVTATYQDTHPDAGAFVNLCDGYLADLDQTERGTFAHGLAKLLGDSLGKLDPLAGVAGKEPRGETRTPELGSVKAEPTAPVAIPPPPTPLKTPRSIEKIAAIASASVAAPSVDAGNAAVALSPAASDQVPLGAMVEIKLVDLAAAPVATPQGEPLIPTREMAELLKPAIADAAEDLSRELGNARDGVVRGVKKRVKKDTVVQAVTAVLVISAVAMLLWLVFKIVAPDYQHSGAVYSDQLKKFAPHLNRPTQ